MVSLPLNRGNFQDSGHAKKTCLVKHWLRLELRIQSEIGVQKPQVGELFEWFCLDNFGCGSNISTVLALGALMFRISVDRLKRSTRTEVVQANLTSSLLVLLSRLSSLTKYLCGLIESSKSKCYFGYPKSISIGRQLSRCMFIHRYKCT